MSVITILNVVDLYLIGYIQAFDKDNLEKFQAISEFADVMMFFKILVFFVTAIP
jgi:hypothetical protein